MRKGFVHVRGGGGGNPYINVKLLKFPSEL